MERKRGLWQQTKAALIEKQAADSETGASQGQAGSGGGQLEARQGHTQAHTPLQRSPATRGHSFTLFGLFFSREE